MAAIRESLPNPPARIGVGVSGGSDSLALLMGLSETFRDQDVKIFVATVNHGLRPEAEDEARAVARLCNQLGVEHSVLRWQDPCVMGNLQGQARSARFQLLEGWAAENQIPLVTLGHTADDQAETVLMRLRREAGVSGLAGIPERRVQGSVEFVRPMLSLRREELRDMLRGLDIVWIDDPSNENDQFERVRTRKALAALEDLGVSPLAFSTVAENLTQARKALEWYSFLEAPEVLDVRFGAVSISRRAFRVLPAEIAHRLLVASFQWLTGERYAPRRQAMLDAQRVVKQGGSHTAAGCRVLSKGDVAWVFREHNAVCEIEVSPGQVWDQRFLVYGGETAENTIRALGPEGLRQCPNWRDLSGPREVLESTPAVWNGVELVAAPMAGNENGWQVTLTRSEEALYTSFLTH